MFDLQLFNSCDHRIVQEILTIEGLSPTFTATLKAPSNKNQNTTFIREYNATEGASVVSQALQGITDYSFSTDGQTIIFGTYPVDSGMRFPDPRVELVPQNIYYIDYTTSANCLKCQDTNLVKDIVFGSGGELLAVETNDKVRQAVLKALLTTLSSNQFDSQYGSGLQDLIGTQIDSFFSVQLQKAIQDTLNHLIDIQKNLNLDPAEQIVRVSDIAANTDSQDPTKIIVTISVTTAAFQDVTSQVVLKT